MKPGKRRFSKLWSPSELSFETNYNDHFETPFQAYLDIKPVIDWLMNVRDADNPDIEVKALVGSSIEISHESNNNKCKIYDPYYCNGRTATLLKQLGYDNIIHANRDFYLDISNAKVPSHDIFITNPPYSDSHKTQCLHFCLQQLRKSVNTGGGIPFLILMPAYVATKQYYRDLIMTGTDSSNDVLYLVPSTDYAYDHPENTGKNYCPFKSLWFLGIGRDHIDSFKDFWQSQSKERIRLTLATSTIELQALGIVSSNNRPNPKQRSRKKTRVPSIQQDSSTGGRPVNQKRQHDTVKKLITKEEIMELRKDAKEIIPYSKRIKRRY
jgi:hypothetical protein